MLIVRYTIVYTVIKYNTATVTTIYCQDYVVWVFFRLSYSLSFSTLDYLHFALFPSARCSGSARGHAKKKRDGSVKACSKKTNTCIFLFKSTPHADEMRTARSVKIRARGLLKPSSLFLLTESSEIRRRYVVDVRFMLSVWILN